MVVAAAPSKLARHVEPLVAISLPVPLVGSWLRENIGVQQDIQQNFDDVLACSCSVQRMITRLQELSQSSKQE
jgi:hypothetical protein